MDNLNLVPISTLPQADNVQPWDVVPIVQNGITKIASAEKFVPAVSSMQTQSSTGSATVMVPAGRLMAFFTLRCSASGAFDLGSTPGATDWLAGEPLADANTWYIYQFMRYGGDVGLDIHFSNLPGTADIKIFFL
jgi:hypothetical protein